jgi:hypothetical protein
MKSKQIRNREGKKKEKTDLTILFTYSPTATYSLPPSQLRKGMRGQPTVCPYDPEFCILAT